MWLCLATRTLSSTLRLAEELHVLEGARDPEPGDLIGAEVRDVAVAKADASRSSGGRSR